MIESKGGTGNLRRKLTNKEYLKRKKRLEMQKAARKRNRKAS